MFSRRSFLGGAAACALHASGSDTLAKMVLAMEAPGEKADYASLVDVMIGTGGQGHTYPGATVPFGAVQLSPDTNNHRGWDSGYRYENDSIMGFSHTHLSGAGAGDLLDFLVMPGLGEPVLEPGTLEDPDAGYRSRFNHRDEHAEPGYYSVTLKKHEILAEMTATERVGVHRYTFPAGSKMAHILVDLKHGYQKSGPTVLTAAMERTAPDTLAGGRKSNGWAKDRELYFTMQFSRQPERVVFYEDDQAMATGTERAAGRFLKCVLFFELSDDPVVMVKTGISGVDADGARRNIAAELPGWDFDGARRQARAQWNAHLERIEIETGSETQKRIFYTALYHLALGPVLFDDVDGRYRGMDRAVHQLAAGQHYYTIFSLWDTFRAVHPLFTLVCAERVPDFVNTLILMAEQSPDGMPVWPLDESETGTMTGYHSAAVIAEACNKGFTGIDYPRAYTAMMKRAMVDDYRGLNYYRSMHYIPCDVQAESVSKTFEYCYDDWSIAHVAHKLGHEDIARMLADRSLNYRNCYDPAIGFAWPKRSDGTWITPIDLVTSSPSGKWRDFTESNAWQTTFGVLHDVAGMIEILGGKERFTAKLDALFTVKAPANSGYAYRYGRSMIGQYDQGNEPSHHIAYLYSYAGAPYKTQERIRMLLDTMYTAAPDGLPGNDDVGQMSAWYLASSMGFYPVDPVSGNYVFGTPLFDHVRIHFGGGRKLEIEARRSSPAAQYVRAVRWNGKGYTRSWINHREVTMGGRLVLDMSSEAQPRFGRREEDLPPSFRLEGA